MTKVLFIEPVLAHYRRDVYQILSSNDLFDILIIAGMDYEGIETAQNQKLRSHQYIKFKVFAHTFYYLNNTFKSVKIFKPDIIVCSGVDFHLLHTILLFVYTKSFTRVKFIWWSHGTFGKQGKIGKWLRGIFYKESDGILSYNINGKNNLVKIGVDRDKICVVGNSINNDEYGFNQPSLSKEVIDYKINILFTGRLTQSKRIDILLEALSILKKRGKLGLRCSIIGGGILDELKSLTQKLNIDEAIDFTGPKYGEEIVPYFQKSDIYVYPGGIGLSMVHALSYGLPVLTSDNIDLHGPEIELLVPGTNGDLFRNNNSFDLANKIEVWSELIKTNKEQIAKICMDTIVEKEYLPDKLASKILSFLVKSI